MSVLLKSLLDRFSLDRGASKEKWAIHHGGVVSVLQTAVMFVSQPLLVNHCRHSVSDIFASELLLVNRCHHSRE